MVWFWSRLGARLLLLGSKSIVFGDWLLLKGELCLEHASSLERKDK